MDAPRKGPYRHLSLKAGAPRPSSLSKSAMQWCCPPRRQQAGATTSLFAARGAARLRLRNVNNQIAVVRHTCIPRILMRSKPEIGDSDHDSNPALRLG